MAMQYKPDSEFNIDLIKDTICTTHLPFLGKVFYIDESKKSSENPYGINFSIKSDSQLLKIDTKKGYEEFQEILLGDDKVKAYDVLNELYLNDNFQELIHSLFHINNHIRHCAFSLLCSKVVVDQKTAPFFQTFFKNNNPDSSAFIPKDFQENYITFLEREFVRWLTAIKKDTAQEILWNNFSEEDQPSDRKDKKGKKSKKKR